MAVRIPTNAPNVDVTASISSLPMIDGELTVFQSTNRADDSDMAILSINNNNTCNGNDGSVVDENKKNSIDVINHKAVVQGIPYDRTNHTFITYVAINPLIEHRRYLVRDIYGTLISPFRVTITFVYLPFGD